MSPSKNVCSSHRSANHLGSILTLTALTVLVLTGFYAYKTKGHGIWSFKQKAETVNIPYKPAKALPSVTSLDNDSAAFLSQTSSITNATECFPLHIRDIGSIGVLFQYCSDEAYNKDGDSVQISEHFAVPSGISRRYNFWRRIYSLWGKDQYVMHLSEYPEVILEAYDSSRLSENIGPVAREIMIKKVAKGQRGYYKKLFLTMHKYRNEENRFTPAMQRLAKSMRHIQSRDKYKTAAYTLRLQRGQRDFIANGLMTAPKYLSYIEKEFKAQGIPEEISRLAFVESSFNLKAHSKVGASGVYQIMPNTGRQYLKMHSGVDERNDPIKASRAAAKLLRLNYKLTGSWPLAITAYNHGVGGIRRATRAVGTNDIVQLINRYYGNAFGFASKNFYASFLGVLATLKDSDRLFPEIPKTLPLAYQDVRLSKPMSIKSLRKMYEMTNEDIAAFNPDITRSAIRGNGILPRGYVLKVPDNKPSEAVTVAADPNS